MPDDAQLDRESAHHQQETGKPEKPSLGPVGIAERVTAVDVLRGVAVLGILGMNVYAYALPYAAYSNPLAYGATSGIDFLVWKFTHLFVDLKFLGIFSMLFGAGLILMSERAEAAGRPLGRVYYRRMFWLLLLGMFHAYILWWGDILFPYALCGLFLYLFRRRSATLLIILGVVVLLIGIGLRVGGGVSFAFLRHQTAEAEAALEVGQNLTVAQEKMLENWQGVKSQMAPSPDNIAKEVEAYRGSYSDIFKHRAPVVVMMHTQALLFFILWRAAGMMLIGMGLMKLGVFSARRSGWFYTLCVLLGYGLGLPLIYYGIGQSMAHNFDFVFDFKIGGQFNYIGSVLVALGHVGVIMLICRSGLLAGFKRRLAAVGRMALTNYLMHTVVFTLIFYGYGLSLFGHVDRFGLIGFMVGMWVIQLIVSPIWLKHFRFGPAEWLWRSLTYWQRQPMRLMQKDSL